MLSDREEPPLRLARSDVGTNFRTKIRCAWMDRQQRRNCLRRCFCRIIGSNFEKSRRSRNSDQLDRCFSVRTTSRFSYVSWKPLPVKLYASTRSSDLGPHPLLTDSKRRQTIIYVSGSQSSIGLSSGSCRCANRPTPSISDRLNTCVPEASICATIASRSDTRKFTINWLPA